MMNPFAQVIGGVIGGFIAGIIGYTVDLALGAIFVAFGTIIPLIALFGAIYGIISFFIGISEVSVAGFFFCIGVMLAGLALHDVVTLVGGFIALVVLVFALLRGRSSSD